MRRDIFIFAAGAIMTALAVRLSAESPFWDFVFVAGIAAMIASTAHGAAERITGQKKMDPLLALAGIAVVIAAVALGLYILRGPHKAISAAPGPDAVSQPELSLLLPKDRYIFKWDPTVGMYFDIQREGLPLPAGQTANPGFVLHNASKTAAADVAITWHAEISGFKELAKVGHAAKYEIKFLDDYTMDLISGTAHPVPNFWYYPNPKAEHKIPFVARDSDLYLPLSIYPILSLFLVAKMPDELGAKTEWFPIRLDVSWNVPDGGEPQHFDIKIRAINTKANAAAEPPEVIGYLDFDISKH